MVVDLQIAGERYRRRRPVGVLALTAVTLFVYWVVWTYKVNDEARRFLGDPTIRPARTAAAMFPGLLLLVPPFLGVWGTARRIQRMQHRAGAPKQVSPQLAVMCAALTLITFVFAGGTGCYLQGHLNGVWDAARRSNEPPAHPKGGSTADPT